MKVLWISHDPVRTKPQATGSSSGYWKESLIGLLEGSGKVDVTVASPTRGASLPAGREPTFRIPPARQFIRLDERTRSDLLRIIDHERPDLIHVHGTEHPYGLIAASTSVPVVVSLQGFLTECLYPLLGNIPLPTWRSFRTWKNFLRQSDPVALHDQWSRQAAVEREIMQTARFFAGRTAFDHDFVRRFNPKARYFVAHEALRPVFHSRRWRLDSVRRHTIHATSIGNPLKGFHVVLEAAAILSKHFPDLRISVAGSLSQRSLSPLLGDAYHRLLADTIRRLDLDSRIDFKGRMSGESMAESLCGSHVFCLASFVENSSNALGEAMLLGMPCLVSRDCGGTPSLVQDGCTGLEFRKGDAWSLAEAISRVWNDDALANDLGEAARRFATDFHDPEKIRHEYLAMYEAVAQGHAG
jgi:glycosyltransferase involved in cell wall biosynthesis